MSVLARSLRQYEFKDGHWFDAWNPGIDDTEFDAQALTPHASWAEAILMDGRCGCFEGKPVAAAMANYLREEPEGFVRYDIYGPLQDQLVAMLATERGLTTHGGNAMVSWLTPAGERWLYLYDNA